MAIIVILLSAAVAIPLLYILWKVRWGPPPGRLPGVLTYHKVTGFEFGGTWITPARFAGHLDFLLDSGYRFIGEDEFLATLGGTRKSDPREILLTFDDAYRMLIDNAIPELRSRNIPALIFIVTAYAGRENTWELPLPGRRSMHMGWDEIADLSAVPGISFGSHSRFHRDLTRFPPDQLAPELSISKEVIEAGTGLPVRCFSYPFGRVNAAVSDAVREAGYEAAFTLYPSGKRTAVDRFVLRREGVWVIDTKKALGRKLSTGRMFWLEDVKGRGINAFAGLTFPPRKNDPFRS